MLRCPTRLTCMDPMPMPLTPCDRLPQLIPDAPFWGGPPRADERIGDAERTRICDELAAHYAAGRLSPTDLDTRLAAAVESVTTRDLQVLTRDLPRLGGPMPLRFAPAPLRPSPWTAMDVLVLLALIGSAVLAGGMLLVLGAYDFALFVAAGLGGSAAFISGAALVHLMHRRTASAPAHRLT